MGWQFAAAEFAGGILMVAFVGLLFRVTLTPPLVGLARSHAERGLSGRMEGHAAMDMSLEGGSVWSRAARASGTMAYQPIHSIAIYAARSARASWPVAAETPSTRYATTAPIHPTENVKCVANTNLRRPGLMVMVDAGCAQWRRRTVYGQPGHGP